MKKQSFFIWVQKRKTTEQGFVLPYVLFITALTFIILTASIHTYQQAMQVSDRQIDQIKIETLLQMGIEKFKQEYITNDIPRLTVDYTFPDGQVTITSDIINELECELHLSVLTVNQSAYTTLHTMNLQSTE